MDNTIDTTRMVRDISLLYELSLAVGNSIDLEQNCQIFLKTLMARKNLAFASVWIKNQYLPDRAELDGASLVYANPKFRIREKQLPGDHPLLARLTEQSSFSLASADPEFSGLVTEKDIDRGTFAVFALGQIGVLKLYAPTREEPIDRSELGQLSNVIDQFAISLEGNLAHRRSLREIAERKQVQQELAQERNLLQALLDNAPDWIFFKDAESRIIRSNKTHAQVLGLDDPQQAVGKTDFDFFPPEDAQRFYEEEQDFLKAGQPIVGRVGPTPAPDGEILWRSETKVPLKDEAGLVIGLIGLSRDVTELKRAEEMLQMRVKELDCLNEVGREIEESPEVPELLQWVTERIPPAMRYSELCQVAVEYDDQVFGVAEASDLPTQMAHGLYIGGELLGRIYIAYTEKRDFLDEESALLGGIATRLSSYIENQRLFGEVEQRAAELTEATNFMDSIIENIPTMLFVKDAEDLRFVRWNKAGEELLGYNREDLMGKNDYDFFPKEEADWFTAKDREVLTGGELVDISEEPIDTLHHGTRFLHTRKIPIAGPDGEPKYLLGLSEDITERKQAEQALRDSEAQLSEVLEIARMAYWELDFGSMMFTFNDQFYALIKTTAEQEGGYVMPADKFAQKIVHPEDAQLVFAEIQHAMEQTRPDFRGQLEYRTIIGDNEERYAFVDYRVELDAEGRAIRAYGAQRDITGGKQADLERERLLAEVEAAYRQYIQQEWQQYLGEQHRGRWRIEHQQVELTADPGGNGRSQTAIEAPIALRGQQIGSLRLEDIDPDRRWTDEEQALVETVSQQLAQTVENLRLFEDTRQRAGREQVTRLITDKMRAAPDADSIIQVGIQELARVLGGSHIMIELDAGSGDGQEMTGSNRE